MAQVPSNLIPISITQLPVSATTSENVLLVGVYDGVTYKFRAGDLLQVAGVPTSRQVIAGTGLTGGGPLATNVTLSVAPGGIGTTQLAATGVTPGVYGNSTSVPQFTVDATGRVTAATTVPLSISGYVPDTRQVIAGNGLTGGGALSSNVTLSASYGGTPLAGSGTGSAGTALTLSRSDHRHPAVDLSDDNQVDNILGLQSGGTARSLVMQPGAIIWSGADGMYVGPAGVSGQVLVSGGTGAPTWGSTLILAPVAPNRFFAGPTSGSDADPVFRTMVNADLPNSGVVANTYGSGTQVPSLVVNSKGVITSASAVDVTPAWANITGTPTTIAGYGITDGVTLTGSQTLTNKTIDASLNTLSNIPNSSLNNSSVTYNGVTVALGGSGTITATTTAALTVGTGLQLNSGTTFDGSAARTISIDSTVATLSGSQTLTNKTISGASNTLSNIGNSSLTNSQITLGTTNIALGGTSLAPAGLTSVTVTQNPTSDFQLATKQYVDGLVSSGITYHTPVKYEVPSINLNATYNQPGGPGVGVGATLTNAGTLGAFTPDGIVALAGDRILIYNQTNQFENGIYTVTVVGDGSTPWVLTRATDADTYSLKSPNGLGEGDAFFITSGNTGAGETYVCNTVGTITFGTTAITFAQISDSTLYTAGTGLTLTGTQFSISNTAVTAGSYGTASSVPTLVINAQGQVTSASNTSIAISASQVTSGTLAVAQGGTGASTAAGARTNLGAVNIAGDTMTGKLTLAASTTAGASINIPQFVSPPTSPVDGDIWYDNPSLIYRANSSNRRIALSASSGTSTSPVFADLGASGSVTFSTTTGLISFGASQTTGLLSVGNTAGTGTITLGQSTASQTTNLQAGATTSGNTKTINIGTGGLSGSTTAIAIGSAVSGATTNVTANGTWSYSSPISGTITTATNLAGGAASQIPYQTGAGATAFIANGTAGQVLTSAGAGAPTWSGISGGTF